MQESSFTNQKILEIDKSKIDNFIFSKDIVDGIFFIDNIINSQDSVDSIFSEEPISFDALLKLLQTNIGYNTH